MKRWTIRVLFGMALAALIASPVAAQVITLTATLSGDQEGTTSPAPGVLAVVTGSNGTATVTVNVATKTITYRVDVFNLPTGINNAHLHVGSRGVAGPTVLSIPFNPTQSNDFVLFGTWTEADLTPRLAQGIGSMDDAIQSILGGQTYINVHTQANPGGEIRGQLTVKP